MLICVGNYELYLESDNNFPMFFFLFIDMYFPVLINISPPPPL